MYITQALGDVLRTLRKRSILTRERSAHDAAATARRTHHAQCALPRPRGSLTPRVLFTLISTTVAALALGAASAAARPLPSASGCPLFPVDNHWNQRIDRLPVLRNSNQMLATIGLDDRVHPDFGFGTWEGAPIGIPFTTVSGSQPSVPVTFDFDDESDPGPYPIPPDAPIEGGPSSDGDRHVIVVDRDHCLLYEGV